MNRFSRVTTSVALFLSVCYLPVSGKGYLSQFRKPSQTYFPAAYYYWSASTGQNALTAQLKEIRTKAGIGTLVIEPLNDAGQPVGVSAVNMNAFSRLTQIAKSGKTGLMVHSFLTGIQEGSVNKDLAIREEIVSGPNVVYRPIPKGTIMSVVGMDTLNFKRYDLTGQVYANRLKWHVPAGTYKILYFYLPENASPDWLDAEAAKSFVVSNYQPFFERYHALFGKTIAGGVTSGYAPSELSWSARFNDFYREKYNTAANLLYPALWYNIGQETESIRSRMFGLRSEALAEAFPGVISQWSAGKGVRGIVIADPAQLTSPGVDAIKRFKYQQVPALKCASPDANASSAVKLVSSAGLNWNAREVLLDVRDSAGLTTIESMEKTALFAYSRGVSSLISQSFTSISDKSSVYFKTDAWKAYGSQLLPYNQLLSRLNLMLQGPATTVADVAVLYPVQTLQGLNSFSKPVCERAYLNMGQLLLDTLFTDYVYIHPDKLEVASVQNGLLRMQNPGVSSVSQLVVVPDSRILSLQVLNKLKAFYDNGGKVIFTGCLPQTATELKDNEELRSVVATLFPKVTPGSATAEYMESSSLSGGRAVFLPLADENTLREALTKLNKPSVRIDGAHQVTCLHKIRDGKNLLFLVNAGNTEYAGSVAVRGSHLFSILNPHNGVSSKINVRTEQKGDEAFTVADVRIPAGKSIFLVSL